MSLHWYAYISTNTYCFEMHHILLETECWALFNASLIVRIRLAIHEILANKYSTVTDDLISQLFVVAFVPPIYVQIALIWGFSAQLSLWKSVYWLWRYKLNEVCDILNMTRDFNIRDNFWDLNFLYHSTHKDTLWNCWFFLIRNF